MLRGDPETLFTTSLKLSPLSSVVVPLGEAKAAAPLTERLANPLMLAQLELPGHFCTETVALPVFTQYQTFVRVVPLAFTAMGLRKLSSPTATATGSTR